MQSSYGLQLDIRKTNVAESEKHFWLKRIICRKSCNLEGINNTHGLLLQLGTSINYATLWCNISWTPKKVRFKNSSLSLTFTKVFVQTAYGILSMCETVEASNETQSLISTDSELVVIQVCFVGISQIRLFALCCNLKNNYILDLTRIRGRAGIELLSIITPKNCCVQFFVRLLLPM